MAKIKIYDLTKTESAQSVRNQKEVIRLLKIEATSARKRGDYLQEMTCEKMIKRLQESLDKYILNNFPVRY